MSLSDEDIWKMVYGPSYKSRMTQKAVLRPAKLCKVRILSKEDMESSLLNLKKAYRKALIRYYFNLTVYWTGAVVFLLATVVSFGFLAKLVFGGLFNLSLMQYSVLTGFILAITFAKEFFTLPFK